MIVSHRRIRRAVTTWTDHLIDADARVEAARAAVDDAVDRLRAAVRERDRTAAHLAHLIAVAEPRKAA